MRYVHSGNYDSTDANDRRGVNISWSQYDTPSANRHVFTFDTPMGDTNYSIVTDRNYEKDNTITIESKSTTGFTGVWVGADPSVFYGTFVIYASTPTKTIAATGAGNSSTEILPVAYAYVNLNNYNSGEANVRRGINISWSEYDTPSANKHVFTFDTPMADSNYAVVTDRPYENDNCIHIYNQSTTGFTAEWDYDNPEVFGGILIVYDQHLQKRLVVVLLRQKYFQWHLHTFIWVIMMLV